MGAPQAPRIRKNFSLYGKTFAITTPGQIFSVIIMLYPPGTGPGSGVIIYTINVLYLLQFSPSGIT